MQSRKTLLLILLAIGAIFLCGCDAPPSGAFTTVGCNYNAATSKWDCNMVYSTYRSEDSGTHISDKYSSYSTDYCSPLDGPFIVRTCEGDEYAPPSPSPSPSPSPTFNGPTYKITELYCDNGGGGGGGITPTFP